MLWVTTQEELYSRAAAAAGRLRRAARPSSTNTASGAFLYLKHLRREICTGVVFVFNLFCNICLRTVRCPQMAPWFKNESHCFVDTLHIVCQ